MFGKIPLSSFYIIKDFVELKNILRKIQMKTYVIYAIFNGGFQVFSTWLLHK